MRDLQELLAQVPTHPALVNPFFERWTSKTLPPKKVLLFAVNYFFWTRSFPNTLASLILETTDWEAKLEYCSTLFSEMGYGNPEKIHWRLFKKFAEDFLRRYRTEPVVLEEEEKTLVLPATHTLIQKEHQLYLADRPGIRVGAQLALEWQAYSMLRKLYEGALLYRSLWADNPDGFHEACEFFHVHLGTAEKDHKQESLRAAEKALQSGASFDDIARGLSNHLALLSEFWHELGEAIGS